MKAALIMLNIIALLPTVFIALIVTTGFLRLDSFYLKTHPEAYLTFFTIGVVLPTITLFTLYHSFRRNGNSNFLKKFIILWPALVLVGFVVFYWYGLTTTNFGRSV